jgi:hypothetical protein
LNNTGSFPLALIGLYIFNTKQSSLCGAKAAGGAWMQVTDRFAINFSRNGTTGCGALNRKSPIGGCAYLKIILEY